MKDVLFSVLHQLKEQKYLQKIGILLCITFVIYLPSLGNQFVDFDDTLLLGENTIVHQMNLHSVKLAFTSYDPELYIPLTYLTYMVEYHFVGAHAFLYHFDSLLLHIFCVGLVGIFLFLLTENRRIALIATVLFALHPMQVEAVAWVAARKDGLSGFFFLASLTTYLLYLKRSTRLLYGLLLGLFILGLLAKVSVAVLPLCFILIDLLKKRSINTSQTIQELLPFILLSIIFLAVAWYGKRGTITSIDPITTMLIVMRAVTMIVTGVIFPFHFSVLYPLSLPLRLFTIPFLVSALFAIIASVVSITHYRRHRLAAFGWWFFIVCLAPGLINFWKAGEYYIVSDRYAYVASVGLFLIVALACDFLIKRLHERSKRQITSPLACLICIALAVLTIQQSLRWHDGKTLFDSVIKLYPDSPVAHSMVGNMQLQIGDTDAAQKEFQIAMTLRPDNAKSYTPLASIAIAKGDEQAARQLLAKALTLDPHDATTLSMLGLMQYNAGNFTAAQVFYEQSLTYGSQRFNVSKRVATLNNLAAVYAAQKKYDLELEQYQLAIALDPTFYYGYYNIGLSDEERGKTDEAIVAYGQAIDINPEFVSPRMRLAQIYAKNSAWNDALDQALIVKQLQPNQDGVDTFIAQIQKNIDQKTDSTDLPNALRTGLGMRR